MGTNKNYNWPEIRAKYETGQYTIKELSEEYGFNYKYGCRKANQEGWVKGARRAQVEEAAQKNAVEEVAKKESQLREEYGNFLDNLRRLTYKETVKKLAEGDRPDFNILKCLKITSEIVSNLRGEQWEVNNIEEVPQKVKKELTGEDGGAITITKLAEEVAAMDDLEQGAHCNEAAGSNGGQKGS